MSEVGGTDFSHVEEIVRQTRRTGFAHQALAGLAQTSRSRVTAINNGNLEGVSIDLLLRSFMNWGFECR